MWFGILAPEEQPWACRSKWSSSSYGQSGAGVWVGLGLQPSTGCVRSWDVPMPEWSCPGDLTRAGQWLPLDMGGGGGWAAAVWFQLLHTGSSICCWFWRGSCRRFAVGAEISRLAAGQLPVPGLEAVHEGFFFWPSHPAHHFRSRAADGRGRGGA